MVIVRIWEWEPLLNGERIFGYEIRSETPLWFWQ